MSSCRVFCIITAMRVPRPFLTPPTVGTAAFWMTGPDAFELVCFRSVADYAGKLLASAAGNVEGIALP